MLLVELMSILDPLNGVEFEYFLWEFVLLAYHVCKGDHKHDFSYVKAT